jgi:hypothetical protein
MGFSYADIPVLEAARRCGTNIDERTLGRTEVRAQCPFCGDKPRGGHFYMNTAKNQYFCFLCGAKGNSVSLYARLQNLSYKEAARELLSESGFSEPAKPRTDAPRSAMRPAEERHAVYAEMLRRLALDKKHFDDLRGRGLSAERIKRNAYASLPPGERPRLLLAGALSELFDLTGVPGFYRNEAGAWNVAGSPGLLIPVRDRNGSVLGMQIRLDGAAKRKYRWLSSGDMYAGTKSEAFVHVTGDVSRSAAYVTEGPLKGDAASFLDGDALFVCAAGVNAVRGVRETVASLGVKEAVVAFDMDGLTNPAVRQATENVKRELSRVEGLKVSAKKWNAAHRGIDNYYLSLRDAAA